jgi:hypothetical protein
MKRGVNCTTRGTVERPTGGKLQESSPKCVIEMI